MSNDYYVVSGDSLREVADTIREKNNTSEQLAFPDEWIDTINSIKTDDEEEIPDDGKTRIWIYISEDTPDNRLTFYLRFTSSVANNTTVDWGDGTSETLGDTTEYNYSHKYTQGGNYVITLTVNTGTISFLGTSGGSGYSIYGYRGTSNYHNRSRIKQIIFGDSVTGVNDYALYQCYALAFITISNSVTSIGNNAFYQCYTLTSITIPNSVTSIGTNAFNNCHGISEYHFKPTTPPTLASTNVFTSIPSDCIIYVPQGSLSAYQSATNYGNVASKMQEEPQ